MENKIIKGKDVSVLVLNEIKHLSNQTDGKNPCVAIVRVGNYADDIAYETSIIKRFGSLNININKIVLDENVTISHFVKVVSELNEDENIHGILIFRPLPSHLSNDIIAQVLNPNKDIDGMTYTNMGRLLAQDRNGFAPCTAQAVMNILDYLNIDLRGLNVTIIGAGQAVGRPLSIMLLNEKATITVCRSATKDLIAETNKADIVIAAAGQKHMINSQHLKDNAIVIDVGINVEDGKIYGDVDFDDVIGKVKYITPVPGGVGMITTLILARNIYLAYLNNINK